MKPDAPLYTPAGQRSILPFKRKLEMGGNINGWTRWGQPVHHLAYGDKNHQNIETAPLLLHLLLKSDDLELNCPSKENRHDTWESVR